MRFATVLSTLAGLASTCSLAQADVLIATATADLDRPEDVRQKIQATGILDGHAIDIFDLEGGTPTAGELGNYDAVLAWNDVDPLDAELWGDRLADYVDNGGGIVQMTFSWNYGNAGRLFEEGYTPFLQVDQTEGVQMGIGAIHCPNHPVMRGVNTFDGGTNSYHNNGDYAPGAIAIADWEDGLPFAAEMPGFNARIIALNFFPPSSDDRADFWDATTDGGILMANALAHAMTPAGPFSSVPRNYKIKQGERARGNKMSLAESDNDRLEVDADQSGNKHRTSTIVTLDIVCPEIEALTLTVETGASASGIKTRIHLYDFVAERWRKIASFAQNRSDRSMSFMASNPARFVEAMTSEAKVRISSKRKGAAYTLTHDHVQADVDPERF